MIRLLTLLVLSLTFAAATAASATTPTKTCHPKKHHKCPVKRAPKPKPRPKPAPPAPPPPPALGTRQNPLPLGQANTGGSWLIKVNSVTPDATAAVLARNRFNKPPLAGRQFFMVNLTVTFTGPTATADPNIDLEGHLVAVGDSQQVYTTFDIYSSCGVLPDPSFLGFGSMLPGATITANTCWSVQSSDVASLEMAYQSYPSHDLVLWWALR